MRLCGAGVGVGVSGRRARPGWLGCPFRVISRVGRFDAGWGQICVLSAGGWTPVRRHLAGRVRGARAPRGWPAVAGRSCRCRWRSRRVVAERRAGGAVGHRAEQWSWDGLSVKRPRRALSTSWLSVAHGLELGLGEGSGLPAWAGVAGPSCRLSRAELLDRRATVLLRWFSAHGSRRGGCLARGRPSTGTGRGGSLVRASRRCPARGDALLEPRQ